MPQSGTNYGGMDTSSKKYETPSIKDNSKSSNVIQKHFNILFNQIICSISYFQFYFCKQLTQGLLIMKLCRHQIYWRSYRVKYMMDIELMTKMITGLFIQKIPCHFPISYGPYHMIYIICNIGFNNEIVGWNQKSLKAKRIGASTFDFYGQNDW